MPYDKQQPKMSLQPAWLDSHNLMTASILPRQMNPY